MKKTFTANINGTVFHIEEDAYDQLHRYLANIRAKFSGSSGSEEIMADIEARIAELFNERLHGRQVVTMADVDHVRQVMGQPEDFTGDSEPEGPSAWSQPAGRPGSKRLFRDPDDSWVGGVLGGIAAYFGTDPLWLRIAAIILLVLGWGSPVLIYLILWVFIPKAETPADKLRMRGEPVTVDNIKRAFDEGTDRFKSGAERVAQEAEELGRRWEDRSGGRERFRNNAERLARGTVSVAGKVIGICFLVFSSLLLYGLLMGGFALENVVFAGPWNDTGVYNLAQLSDAWFISPSMANWAFAGIAVLLLVPIVGLILAGIRLLFGIRTPSWTGWVLGPAWIASILLLSVIGVRHLNEFRQRERSISDTTLPVPAGNVLHIATGKDDLFGNDRLRHSDVLDLIDIAADTITWGSTELDVLESPDSLYHIEVVHQANGPTVKEALRRARDIRSTFQVEGDRLTIAPVYTSALDQKLRGQQASFIVRVPVGSSVHFERGTERIINDIQNTTDTWDRDMVGRTWTMTRKGLAAGTEPDTTATPERPVRNADTTRRSLTITASRPTPPEEPAFQGPGLVGLLEALVRI